MMLGKVTNSLYLYERTYLLLDNIFITKLNGNRKLEWSIRINDVPHHNGFTISNDEKYLYAMSSHSEYMKLFQINTTNGAFLKWYKT